METLNFEYTFLLVLHKKFLCIFFNATIANVRNMYTIIIRALQSGVKTAKYNGVSAFKNITKRKDKNYGYVWIWSDD